MKHGAWVMAGVPRSGTSLLMGCMLKQYGPDIVIGTDTTIEMPENLERDDVPAKIYDIVNYNYKNFRRQQAEERRIKARDMNPTGFWETGFTVSGLTWQYRIRERLAKLTSGEEKAIMKIVSGGLLQSDPRYIGKVVYTLRAPKKASKSQERIRRGPQINGDSLSELARKDGYVVNNPEMFIKNSYQAAKFFVENPDIPVFLYNYDLLIDDPETTLKDIVAFVDGSEVKQETIDFVDKTLRRSKPEDIETEIDEEAEVVYQLMSQKKFKEVVDYVSDESRNIHSFGNRFYCSRLGRDVVKAECRMCKSDPEHRKQFKHTAIRKGIDYTKLPCTYECGFDEKSEPLTPVQSIENNFWSE